MKLKNHVTFLLALAGVGLLATVVVAATQAAPQQASAVRPVTKAQPATAKPQTAAKPRVSAPPLPNVGFAPVRPMDIVRATYDFAAQHPEILGYVPCYCGCGSQGHKANDSCFVARRDAKGNVLEWDTHGFGCTICVDVAREAMQMYTSGADVRSIRAAIERKWTPGNAAGKTPTPPPPAKKTS
ncbi:MAG TPA: PCYCGC motif-containing (lipo)protein [Vicinamibacterales bacterium]|nr:PCYCGC motif-containing (lipo)protein [Vicinamibacterales bacterium]